jgi:O-antigen ligase
MTPLVGGLLLGLTFLTSFVASVSSRTARLVVVPTLIGISAGLFSVQIANIHLFTPLAAAWFLARAGRGEVRLRWRVIALPVVCVPIAITVFLGDLVVNPNLALQLLALALSGAFLVAGWTADLRRPILLGLLTSTTASSLLGLLQVAKVVPTDLWHVDVSALGRPTGFYPEPDWLGMYAGVGALLSWRLQLSPKTRIVIVLINLSALVLAFARAAWLGFAVAGALAIVLWLLARKGQEPLLGNGKTGRLRAIVMTLGALVVAVTVLPELRRDLLARLSSTLTAHSTDISAQARVEQNRTLAALADSAPWYGHGLSASGRVGVSGIFYSAESANSVASNWVLGFWVDSAWLAVPFFALVLLLIVVSLRRVEGSLLLVVVVSSFFSNAFFQPVLWTLLALVLAGSGGNTGLQSPRTDEIENAERSGRTLSRQGSRALFR